MGTNKLKIIKDYEKMSDELLEQLKLEYPNGFSNYIFEYVNPKDGRLVRAVELETEDKLYLIRLPQDSDSIFIGDDDSDLDIDGDDIIDDDFDNAVEIGDMDLDDDDDDDIENIEDSYDDEEDEDDGDEDDKD